jgi:hypothetical protein
MYALHHASITEQRQPTRSCSDQLQVTMENQHPGGVRMNHDQVKREIEQAIRA